MFGGKNQVPRFGPTTMLNNVSQAAYIDTLQIVSFKGSVSLASSYKHASSLYMCNSKLRAFKA